MALGELRALCVFAVRFLLGRAYPAAAWKRAAYAEVALQEVEVGGVDDVITGEVGAAIVAGVSRALAERAFQDIEVPDVDDVIAVGVACFHQAELYANGRRGGYGEDRPVSQVLGAYGARRVGAWV